MSLIGDALRKTRQEAAERDSDRKGVLFSAKIADKPARSGLGLGLFLGALIAIIATVAGGGTVWWVLNSRAARETPTEKRATASLPAPPASEPQSSVPIATAVVSATGVARPTTPTVTTAEPSDPVVQEAPTNVESIVPPHAPEARDQIESSEDVPATGFVGKEDGTDVYLMEADLGDVTLSLDFLVYRPTDPYAEINGVEVHIGGTVAGFRVKSVERNRVVLSDGRRTIVLRAP